jgi:hypothetical protein
VYEIDQLGRRANDTEIAEPSIHVRLHHITRAEEGDAMEAACGKLGAHAIDQIEKWKRAQRFEFVCADVWGDGGDRGEGCPGVFKSPDMVSKIMREFARASTRLCTKARSACVMKRPGVSPRAAKALVRWS